MNKGLKKMLNNEKVELGIFIFTCLTSLSMLLQKNISCLLTMGVVILISRYFTNNMSIILLSGLVVTLMFCNLKYNIVENLENKVDNEEEEDENNDSLSRDVIDEASDDEDKEEMSNLNPKSLNDEPIEINNNIDKVGKLDHAASVEAAYDNLDKILSSDAIKNMSKDTVRLADKQENLIKQMKNFEPMMKQAEGMLKSLGNFDLDKLFKK
jgi:hypothetical protein